MYNASKGIILSNVESNHEEKGQHGKDNEDALKCTEVETIYLKSQSTCTNNLSDASVDLSAPKNNNMLLGQVCVCEYVHVNLCLQTSNMSSSNVTDHVLYQNILWNAWEVGHGINLDYYVNLLILFGQQTQ